MKEVASDTVTEIIKNDQSQSNFWKGSEKEDCTDSQRDIPMMNQKMYEIPASNDVSLDGGMSCILGRLIQYQTTPTVNKQMNWLVEAIGQFKIKEIVREQTLFVGRDKRIMHIVVLEWDCSFSGFLVVSENEWRSRSVGE